MLREDYLSLKTADGFYLHRCPDFDVVYSSVEENTIGYLRKVIELGTFESAEKLMSEYFLVEENMLTLNIKDKQEKAEKLMLVITESDKCLAEIKRLMASTYYLCENARSIEVSNRIFWSGLEEAKKIAFENINPTVKPQVVYRINWWYNLLK